MKRRTDKIVYSLLTLVVAVFMSAYTDSQSTASNRRSNDDTSQLSTIGKITSSQSETVSVPIQFSGINTDDYYISGAPDNVAVTISGPSALVTAAKNTKNFQVSANLKNLSDGTHTVSLKVTGLNKDLTYKLKTPKVTLTMYKRTSSYYSVKTNYNKDAIADGYTVGTVTSSVNNVQIMGRQAAINAVDNVVADVQLKRDTKKTVRQKVTLQAVDVNGNPVDVAVSPQVTTVKVPVKTGNGTRQIPLDLKTKNGNASEFSLSGSINEVAVQGNTDVLDKIKNVEAVVDLSGVTTTTEKDVTIKVPDGAESVDPKTVSVVITPKE
ncbi:putative secreted protein associated with spyDAC [Weissella jogaejeotgali]|uniref:Putative secreted protein associated with spyDAC n=1 Tax=Weissella jogaejeotgali TaxID=1631871 RepID=A0A1L6RA45_9LACO|nr:CdaR family protein [Weissella jogaejeotgali]APS41395.1 putative secreted protein associated with spyDAC [Weissella jogaejeotgali]